MNPDSATHKIDIREYLRPLRKYWWLIVLVVTIVTVGTYVYYDRKPEVYSAATEVFAEKGSSLDQILFGGSGSAQQTVENLAILLQTTAVAEEVAEDIGFKGNPRALLGSVSAAAEGDSDFILVTATAGTGRGAAQIANGFADAFIDLRNQDIQGQAGDALDDARKQLEELGGGLATRSQRDALLSRIDRLELIRSAPAGAASISVVEPAVAPTQPIEPQPRKNAIFAFVVSLALAIAGAFGLDRLDRRIQRIEDVEDALPHPVLTELPRVDTPTPMVQHEAIVAELLREPFRRLQMNLDIADENSILETIVVASAVPGEGKSTVARNLALAYRDAGKRVALFDADFRKPSMARMLELEGELGLSSVLAGSANLDMVLQDVPAARNGNGSKPADDGPPTTSEQDSKSFGVVAEENAEKSAVLGGGEGALSVVTTGQEPANPAAALATTRMQEVIDDAAERFDTVLIDSPPILAVSDSLPLLSAADGVILVTRMGVSTRDATKRMLTQLERLPDVNVIGVVVNGVPPRTHKSRAYGYGYS